MSLKRRLFDYICDGMIAVLGLNRPIRAYRLFLSRIDAVKDVTVDGVLLRFDANEEMHLLRASILREKEPETIEWINGFSAADVLFDVGANVGEFSLYAARRSGCRVFAFEPEAKNYACLNRNIWLNGLNETVEAINAAIYDHVCLDHLRLHDLRSGSALHSVGEPIDWKGEKYRPVFSQAVLAITLDEFVNLFKPPFPTQLKIDVDGNETKVIMGARRVLSDNRLKSISMEMDENNRDVIAVLEASGLKFKHKKRIDPDNRFRGVYNFVFAR